MRTVITALGGAACDYTRNHPATASFQRSLMELPEDVLERILGSLCLRDSAGCAQACRSLRRLMQVSLLNKKVVHTSLAKRFHSAHSHVLVRWLASYCPHVEDVSLIFMPLYNARQLGLLDAWLPFAHSCAQLRQLTLLNVHINDASLSAIAEASPRLHQLVLGCEQGSVYGCLVGDRGLKTVAAKCPQMQVLALLRCRVGDAGLRAFVNHQRNLTHVTLHLCEQVSRNGVITLAEGCHSLSSLDVLMCEVGVNATTCLDFATMFVLAANCQELQELRVSEELTRIGVLDDACVSLLVDGCPKLQRLEFVQVELTDMSLMKLSVACTSLRSLRLEKTYVADAGLRGVAQRCLLLQDISITGRSDHFWALTDEVLLPGPSLAAVREFGQHSKHLTSMHFSGLRDHPSVTEHPLMSAEVAGGLQSLSFNWPKLDHPCFNQRLQDMLAKCSSLTSLSLVGFHDTMQQVLEAVHPAACKSLAHLNLSHTQVGDATVQYTSHTFLALEHLHLGSCRQVTDGGLRHLTRLPNLQLLDLHNVPHVTDQGVANLAKRCRSLSHLNVGHSPGCHRKLTLDGCKALYQVSRDVNTHLHVELGLPHPPSQFQQASLQRLRLLAGPRPCN